MKRIVTVQSANSCLSDDESADLTVDVCVQTDLDSAGWHGLETLTIQLQKRIAELVKQVASSQFRLTNISEDNQSILFYTGFPDYATLKACYDYRCK